MVFSPSLKKSQIKKSMGQNNIDRVLGVKKIGLVGIRGLPPNYGGYETLASKLGPYLADRGHRVLVSCERPRNDVELSKSFKGTELLYFPIKAPSNYRLRKIYEGLNDLYFYFRIGLTVDVMYVMAGIGTQALALLRLLRPGLKIVTNSDGIEWERAKFGLVERILIKSFIKSSLRFSHSIIHDHPRLEDRFPKHNSKKVKVIEYGADLSDKIEWDGEFVERSYPQLSSISPGDYYILVARLQSDNNVHTIIDGFLQSKSNRKLVVVGNLSDSGYGGILEDLTKGVEQQVIMPGGIYDSKILNMLRQNAYCAFHGHSAGGTNPALLEAMGTPMHVIAHRNEFNEFVLAEKPENMFIDSYSLSEIIKSVDLDSSIVEIGKKKNLKRVMNHYTWERCLTEHEKVFLG